jgi:DNA gyrase subunit B
MRMDPLLLKIMVVVFQLEFIKKKGVSALEVVMTKIGAGGKFDKDSLQGFWRIAWVGVSVVNAV